MPYYSNDLADWGALDSWEVAQYGVLMECFAAHIEESEGVNILEDFIEEADGNGVFQECLPAREGQGDLLSIVYEVAYYMRESLLSDSALPNGWNRTDLESLKIVTVTYDLITEASARIGDVAVSGYINAPGDEVELIAPAPLPLMSLAEGVMHLWNHNGESEGAEYCEYGLSGAFRNTIRFPHGNAPDALYISGSRTVHLADWLPNDIADKAAAYAANVLGVDMPS